MRREKAAPTKLELAKELRRTMTAAEAVLWALLRADQLNGFHFRRQEVVAGFIVDFYCHRARLCIEVDGPIHDGIVESDEERDCALTRLGYHVLRIRNEDVMHDKKGVLARIHKALDVIRS